MPRPGVAYLSRALRSLRREVDAFARLMQTLHGVPAACWRGGWVCCPVRWGSFAAGEGAVDIAAGEMPQFRGSRMPSVALHAPHTMCHIETVS